jgi:hypothetical protein
MSKAYSRTNGSIPLTNLTTSSCHQEIRSTLTSTTKVSPKRNTCALETYRPHSTARHLKTHDLYLKTDVIILADIFENFRDLSLTTYELDPAQYVATPSLKWDVCLKHTKISLDMITDAEMFTFFESGMRGGISVISNRFARANNP